jgi:hypothetical protein
MICDSERRRLRFLTLPEVGAILGERNCLLTSVSGFPRRDCEREFGVLVSQSKPVVRLPMLALRPAIRDSVLQQFWLYHFACRARLDKSLPM